MAAYETVRLDDVATVRSGYAFKSTDWTDEGVPVIKIQNVRAGRVDPSGCSFVSAETAAGAERYRLSDGDILVTMSGEIGSIGLVRSSDGWMQNQRVGKVEVRQDLCAPMFLYYALQHPDIKREMEATAYGAAQPNISPKLIGALEIPMPDKSVQVAVSEVLSAYDELIENNKRRIKILEATAQSIYKEWFVTFRYPGNESIPLVDSELGPIPVGWHARALGDALATVESGTRPKGGIDPNERGIPSVGAENVTGIGQYDFSKEKFVSRMFFEAMKRGRVESGDVLLYKDGAYIGRSSMFGDGFPHVECAINEHVFLLRSNDLLNQNYLYFWLSNSDTYEVVRSKNSNAAQPGLNQRDVKGVQIRVPDRGVLDQFDSLVNPMVALIFNLARANRELRHSRDLLLPRLISGDVDVIRLD